MHTLYTYALTHKLLCILTRDQDVEHQAVFPDPLTHRESFVLLFNQTEVFLENIHN